MARRRVYKPAGYRDGGAVPVTPEAASLAHEPDVVADVPSTPAHDANDALKTAIQAQERAEELARRGASQTPERPARELTVAEYVDTIPDISAFKRATLKAHPELFSSVAAEAYREALELGIADDTEQMNAYLLSSVRADAEFRHQRRAEAARAAGTLRAPPRPDFNIDQEVAKLNNEVASIQATTAAANATPMSVAPQVRPEVPRQSFRSMPMAAPVSREVPLPSGQRFSSSQIHLTREEVEIARNSFSSDLTNAEKERLYAMNKAKLARMRAEGSYRERERG